MLANAQIVTAYEELGMTPEQIAEDCGYDLVAVKSCLLQNSTKFKSLVKPGPNNKVENVELFTDEELKSAGRVMVELMRESEVDSVKLRAAEFVINEKKGRNDIKNLANNKFNIVMFNQTMNALRARKVIGNNNGNGNGKEEDAVIEV